MARQNIVETELIKALRAAYDSRKGHLLGTTFVACIPSGMGTTVASTLLLLSAAKKTVSRGRLIKVDSNLSAPLKTRVAQALCVPTSFTDKSNWLEELIRTPTTMPSKTWTETAKSFVEEIVNAAISQCYVAPPVESRATQQYPPVILLDGLQSASEEIDASFLYEMAKAAEECGVLLIIATSDKKVANDVCKLSERGPTIQPLPGLFDDEVENPDWKDFKLSRAELTAILLVGPRGKQLQDRKHFFDDENCLKFVEEGMKLNDDINLSDHLLRNDV